MPNLSLEPFKNKKTALVLSGGVAKAASWHLGVALALTEMGFTLKNNDSENSEYEIGTYVGSSAGALVSLFFASGLTPMDLIEAHLDGKNSKIRPITYRDMLSLKKPMKNPPKSKIYDPFEGFPMVTKRVLSPLMSLSGLFSTTGLKKYIEENIIISNSFDDYKSDLFVVATQLDHSRKVIFSKYNFPNPSHDNTATYYTGIPVEECVAASMSVPPFYSPYPVYNPHTEKTDYYIDGEIRETLSTHVAVDNGCEFILSSWTHTPYHYNDEVGSLINYGLPAICTQSIFLMIQKKIVSSRARNLASKDIIDTVNDYLLREKFEKGQRMQLVSILERKLNYNPKTKFIDIFPKHNDYKLFFQNSFSLNPEKMSHLVTGGYKRTIEVFKKREWEK